MPAMFRVLFVVMGLFLLGGSVVADDKAASPMPFPLLPEGISSFGATVCDGHLYVFGGHAGQRDKRDSVEGLSEHFVRINLTNPGEKWESLEMLKPSQSPGLVTWNGQIYRVGGLSFRNHVGEETSYESLATFARYEPKSNSWKELPSLPTPRSSLDAAVVDGKLYVVGGWNLQENSPNDAPWHEEVLVFDLANEAGSWTAVAKPPFKTRALATAGLNHKLYVMGGMNDNNSTTLDVHVYDPQSNSWSAGPKLAGGETLSGFAISAYVADGKLYYSGSEGVVYRLSEDGTKWESVQRLLFPRSFHRLVAEGNMVYVVAGVSRGGYLGNSEVVDVTKPATEHKLVEWSVNFGGKAKQGQALLLSGSSLYTFGGNSSRGPHDFEKENFCNESFRYDLAGRTVERLADMPQATQGGVAHIAGSRIDQSIYVIGGFASPGEKYASMDTIQQYRMRSKSWEEEIKHLPSSRSMFGVAAGQGEVWVFGGARVNTEDKGLVSDAIVWKPGSDEAASVVADAGIPTPRRSFGATVLDGKYYVVGGLGEKTSIVASASVFDLTTKKWSDIASPHVARVFPSLAAAGGKLFLAGGFASVEGHFQPARTVEVYDPAANSWSTAFESLPLMERASTMIEFQDRLLFFGVDREKDGVANFALLDPQPNTVGFGKQPPLVVDERGVSAEMVTRLLRMDKNKDGKLSKDEVGERFLPIIDRADADKDGTASKEELEAIARPKDAPEGRGPRT